MAAAVSRVQSQRLPPIGLKEETAYEDLTTCRIYHEWTNPNTNDRIKRSADTLYSPDASNKELLLRSFHEYSANCADDLLRLNDMDRHTRAREILGGHLKTRWTQVVATARAAQPATVSNDDFANNVRTFMRKYLPANAFLLQDTYLRSATKPYAMDCYALADRIDLINELSVYLPGGNGTKLFGNGQDDTERKNAYYRLMPSSWQLNFDATGNDLANDAYTIDHLVSFMEQQRLLQDNKSRQTQRSRSRTTPSRGRNSRHSPYPRSRSSGRGSYDQYPRTSFRQQYSSGRGYTGGRGYASGRGSQGGRGRGRSTSTQTYGTGRHGYGTRASTGGNARQYAPTHATRNLYFNGHEDPNARYEDEGYFQGEPYEEPSGHPSGEEQAYFHGEPEHYVHEQQQPDDGFYGEHDDAGHDQDDYPQDFFHDHDPQEAHGDY